MRALSICMVFLDLMLCTLEIGSNVSDEPAASVVVYKKEFCKILVPAY